MGILRLFLALTVLDWHYRYSDSIIFPHVFAAVCCFYIISGFYMSLVINEKYGTSSGGIARFYLNRVLRLYPIYVTVLAAFAITGALGITWRYGPFSPSVPMSLLDRLLSILNQVLIFPNVVWQNLTLLPAPAYNRLLPAPADNNLVLGQMYTVGLEMMFYAVAPFLVTCRPRFLIALTLVAAGIHFGLHGLGLPPRPWQYEFFPGVLVFFLLGCLSYRFLRVVRDWRYPKWVGFLTLPLFLLYGIWGHDASTKDFTNGFKIDGLYLLTMLIIPFLFEASKSVRWDRYIGDLSYPVYVVHFLIGFAMVGDPGTGSIEQNRSVLVVVMLAAFALLITIEYPIDLLRYRIGRVRRGGAVVVPVL
jgi:peptidoglycan/LPS O-acetylase OafA/YrhL